MAGGERLDDPLRVTALHCAIALVTGTLRPREEWIDAQEIIAVLDVAEEILAWLRTQD